MAAKWEKVANMVQKYFMYNGKSAPPFKPGKRSVNDYEFEYLSAVAMHGKKEQIGEEDVNSLLEGTLMPVMLSYKKDVSLAKYWDDGVNFGFLPTDKAKELAAALGGAVLFFCCESLGNYGVATPEGKCFFIVSEKLTKHKTIATLILSERSITDVLVFVRKPFEEYTKTPEKWWDNLRITKKDKSECFHADEAKEMDVPDGYTPLN